MMMGAAMFIGGQTFAFLTLLLYDDSYPDQDISRSYYNCLFSYCIFFYNTYDSFSNCSLYYI